MRVRPPLVELTVARAKEFVREPEAIFWVFAVPIVFSIVLGFAFRAKPPDRTPVAVAIPAAAAAGDGSAAMAAMAALARSPFLAPRPYPEAAGHEALRTGKVSLLVTPGGGGSRGVTFEFDPTQPESRIARLEAQDALERAAGRADVVPVRAVEMTEKGSRYIDFLIPGLLGMNLMGTGIWSLAFSITNARSRRILKRLVATPMRRSDFLLAQIFARLVFLAIEVTLLVGFGWIVFGVAVRGSILLLLATCFLGAMCFCGLGLLIASRVTTLEGASGLTNLVMLPMWLCSGVFFSSDRFPAKAQPLIQALPLTALNNALRDIMNEAKPLSAVAPALALLAAWGVVSFAVALKIFKWK
ncbi:MAG TPA: ABC transporter permease [Thermoanaerobaculia bacterium]